MGLMSKHTQGDWAHGFTIETETTRRWTDQQKIDNAAREELLIFGHFTVLDQGRSRVLICEMNRQLLEWKANRSLIESAPDLYEACVKALVKLSVMLANQATTPDSRRETIFHDPLLNELRHAIGRAEGWPTKPEETKEETEDGSGDLRSHGTGFGNW